MKHITYFLLVVLFIFQGCGGNPAGSSSSDLTSSEALTWFKAQVQRYADGGKMLDEQADFPAYLEALKKDQPEKAALLETGLSELKQVSGKSLSKRAKELLEKL